MSRKKNKSYNHNTCDANEVYWQSAYYNQRYYQSFFNQCIELAMSRFKWLNLPPTCDARFLEWSLLFEGCATIAFPRKQPGVFYSTRAVPHGPFNIYFNPRKWDSYGENGWRFRVNSQNGVFVYDNMARYPIIADLSLYARELTDIMRTKQINRMQQKVPFVLKGPHEKEFDMLNIYKQIVGNEPAVLATNGIDLMDIEALNTSVPYLGRELGEEYRNMWNIIYTRLGIKNLPYKSERQIEDEVESMTVPAELMALSPLECRRKACDDLNNRFERYLTASIECVWNVDALSHNYALMVDMSKRLEADD